MSYVRSSLIFVKSNSRGANKSSVAAAERRSFVSSFSSPLSDSLRSPLFVSTTDHGYGLFSENHRSARFSNSIARFNFDLKEKKLDRQIRETRIPSVRSLFSQATTREWLARQTDLPPCHSLLCHLFFARFTLTCQMLPSSSPSERCERNERVSRTRRYLSVMIRGTKRLSQYR